MVRRHVYSSQVDCVLPSIANKSVVCLPCFTIPKFIIIRHTIYTFPPRICQYLNITCKTRKDAGLTHVAIVLQLLVTPFGAVVYLLGRHTENLFGKLCIRVTTFTEMTDEFFLSRKLCQHTGFNLR